MTDKELEGLFDELLNRFFDEFSEAILVPEMDDKGMGALMVELDNRLFQGKFRKELEKEYHYMGDHRVCEEQWFQRGR